MSIINRDIPHLEWRAAEAGCTVDELRQFEDVLTPDLDGHTTNNSPDQDTPALPSSSLIPRGDVDELYPLGNTRIAFIGAGAGSILLASYLTGRGADSGNMTILDPSGDYGGKWRSKDVRVGGFNNPQALSFADHRLPLDNRSGDNMIGYLEGIAHDYLEDVPLLGDSVSSISPLTREDTWLVGTENGDRLEADIVVMAAGTPKPNKIDGSRISSNLDQFPSQPDGGTRFVVERNQRGLTDEELEASANGKPIVIVGLGNSMAAMIHQIQKYEDSHFVTLNYVVLTDRGPNAIEHPDLSFGGKRSIFRDPQNAYLTGYSADLARDHDSYFRALYDDRILPSISDVNYDEATGQLVVKDRFGEERVFNNPQVFALLGHSPDTALFRQLGALADNGRARDERLIRANDGAVHVHDKGYLSNVYAIGSMAATYANRNSLVIPGIKGQVRSTVLTIGVRSLAEQVSRPEVPSRPRRALQRALRGMLSEVG